MDAWKLIEWGCLHQWQSAELVALGLKFVSVLGQDSSDPQLHTRKYMNV